MTAAGLHHLPEDRAAWVRGFVDTMRRLGVTFTPGQVETLHTVHEFGLLDGPSGVGRMLSDLSPGKRDVEARAAADRRLVRRYRDAEAKFHASQPHPRQTRAWSLIDGGFRCHLCKTDFLRYVDPAGAASAAQDHTQQCPGGGTDE